MVCAGRGRGPGSARPVEYRADSAPSRRLPRPLPLHGNRDPRQRQTGRRSVAPRQGPHLDRDARHGGYALAPCCPPECHETGGLYEHHAGPALAELAAISADERETLIRCARSFDLDAKKGKTIGGAAGTGEGGRPGDDFNRRGPDWQESLGPHGWELAAGRAAGERRWRRPGKSGPGWSATTGRCRTEARGDLFRVFSSNADPFEDDCAYSKFETYTVLNHAGDYKAAAKELARQGYGDQTHNGDGRVPRASTMSTPGVGEKDPAHEKHRTDKGNARRVVERHGKDLHYVHPWKEWLVWDGKRWQEDYTGEALRRVKETQDALHRWAVSKIKELGEVGDDADRQAQKAALEAVRNHVLKWEDWRRTTASLSHAQSEPGVPILPDDLDADPMLFNVANGTIDLRTRAARSPPRGPADETVAGRI